MAMSLQDHLNQLTIREINNEEFNKIKRTKNGYHVFPKSYISIPIGTKLTIFVNDNNDDPNSDMHPVDIITTNRELVFAVLVNKLTCRNL